MKDFRLAYKVDYALATPGGHLEGEIESKTALLHRSGTITLKDDICFLEQGSECGLVGFLLKVEVECLLALCQAQLGWLY